jgi:two-component system cell cycle sensor histidine kinase/response regulator CckA
MQPNRVLLVDDDELTRKLGRLRLVAAGFAVECANDAEEALAMARRAPPDAILSDVLMGEVDGFGLCRRLRDEAAFDAVPVVLISAHFNTAADRALAEEVGANALVQRTPDFAAEISALKGSLTAGPRRCARPWDAQLQEKHLRRVTAQLSRSLDRAKRSELRYQLLLDNATDNICVIDAKGFFVEANRRMEETLKVPRGALNGRHMSEFSPADQADTNAEAYHQYLQFGRSQVAVPVRASDGTVSFIEFASSVIEIDGVQQSLSIGRDVTQSLRAAAELRASEERHRGLLERLPDIVWTSNANGDITFISPNVVTACGFTPAEIYAGGAALWHGRIHPHDSDLVKSSYDRFLTGGPPFDRDYRWQRKDGRWICIRSRSSALYDQDGVAHCEGTFADVTHTRQLEETLRQSQKIEAIGQLAGGVAHDFNNILAVILTNCQFMLEGIAEDDSLRLDALDICTAAERAVTLTRQLTAFSRIQVLEPKVISLNSAISDVWKMIKRIIGEDIEVHTSFDPAVGNVSVDVTQMAQVVMNLVINARDAMPAGGTLTLETANVEFDQSYLEAHPDARRGRYVMLAVSDNGMGMDESVKSRIFEPFFTTKDQGKGTGLGLSTVYGIVKQSGGYVCTYSEVGYGSVFKVYLPRVDADAESVAAAAATRHENLGAQGERVLVLEDEPLVKNAVVRILKSRGYEVLTAATPAQAIMICQDEPAQIDLLLSDVILPGASGAATAEALLLLRPAMKVLFMSGFTDHAIVRHGVLGQGVNFIQKPFTPLALSQKIRTVLAAPTAS